MLKVALVLATWEVSLTRPTTDIDLLGHVANDIEPIVAVDKEVCRQEVPPDGLDFNPARVVGERIAEEAEYEGVGGGRPRDVRAERPRDLSPPGGSDERVRDGREEGIPVAWVPSE